MSHKASKLAPIIFNMTDADEDRVWMFECALDELWKLLQNPPLFVNESVKQDVLHATETYVIAFQYDETTPPEAYHVHGAKHSNLITVRCPAYTVAPDAEASRSKDQENGDASVDVFLVAAQPVEGEKHRSIALGHYDPKWENGIPLEIYAQMMGRPPAFVEYLNNLNEVSHFLVPPDQIFACGKPVTFKTGAKFRFRCELSPPFKDLGPEPRETMMQCTKFAGTYDPDAEGGEEDVPMTIDEAWMNKWHEEGDKVEGDAP